MAEPENLVLVLLREMRAEMATKADVARLENDIADVRSEVRSLRADVASDLIRIEANLAKAVKRLVERIAGLRRSVMEYHSSAIGHGVLFTELEERILRLEDKVSRLASDAH